MLRSKTIWYLHRVASFKILFFDQGYQFWTRANKDGYFSINDIRTGDYNLYAWVPGFIGDYHNDAAFTITSGHFFDF
jgi:hypothetical protein